MNEGGGEKKKREAGRAMYAAGVLFAVTAASLMPT